MQNFNSLPDKYLQSNFPKWMFWSRVSQFVSSLFVFALCAYATSEFKFGLTFIGLNMFTAFLTIIVVPYTFIAPRKLPNFYHVYGEAALEFFLFFFWLVSFAAMANVVAAFNMSQYLNTSLDTIDPGIVAAMQANPLVQGINKAMNTLKAVIVFGALVL
jgi:ABC-type transport system involved in cytochrome bd biosynthesis fused ATPase/permease subunit